MRSMKATASDGRSLRLSHLRVEPDVASASLDPCFEKGSSMPDGRADGRNLIQRYY